jgi:hypothetical protein
MKQPGDNRSDADDAPGPPVPQIATGDLDIAIIGQLLAANLPLGNGFEPGPINVIAFEAAFRRWGLR